jgi:hypothetical protein
VVSPEGTGTQPDRPRTGRGALLAVAALVIAAGFGVLGALSPAEEIAVETTTTTTTPATTTTVFGAPIDLDNFDVGQIVTGEPLELTRAATIEEGYPLALVEQDDGFYAFVTTTSEWLPSRAGLLAWHSLDGARWSPLGMVIDDGFQVSRVIATDEDSMLAVGVSIDDGTVMMWRSDDGVVWDATRIGEGSGSAYQRTIPTAVGISGDTIVVATTNGDDLHGLVERALEGSGIDVDLSRWGWGMETEPDGSATVVVTGPLGIEIARVPIDGTDLSDEERRFLETGFTSGPADSKVWVFDPGSGWFEQVIVGMYGVESISPRPSGGLVARGWGNSGMVTATSEDGRVWDRVGGTTDGPWTSVHWGELLVGPDDMSVSELLISDDGQTWEQAGLAPRFPVAINWSTYPLGAGPAGVALVVSGSSAGPQIETPDPSVLATDKDHTIILDPNAGRLTIVAGGVSHTWHVYGAGPPDDILVDVAEETIELLDSEAGISFGRVTFDEIQRAENEFFASNFNRGHEHRALVFTPDTETWVIQDLADSIGPQATVTNLMVGSDRLMAVVLPEGEWYYPAIDPGFEIWTAPVP